MARFEVGATVTQFYAVEASDEREAEAKLKAALGEGWDTAAIPFHDDELPDDIAVGCYTSDIEASLAEPEPTLPRRPEVARA
jgi:hypothetical protein